MTTEAERLRCPVDVEWPSWLEPLPDRAVVQGDGPLAPVLLPSGRRAWLVTGYEEAKTVLSDLRFSRASGADDDLPRLTPRFAVFVPGAVINFDPPEHTRLRALLHPAFANHRITAIRSRVAEIVDEHLDRMAEAGPPADLVADFALPVPITVIGELLGIPPAGRDPFLTRVLTLVSLTGSTADQVVQAHQELVSYFAELLAAKRAAPADDLLDHLLTSGAAEDRLSDGELIDLLLEMVISGNEPVGAQLASFVLTLLQHPDQLQRLRDRPDLVPGAVEELLRHVPFGNGGGLVRIATEDVRLGDVTIRAGDILEVDRGSAQRDPAVLPNPDDLDVTREKSPHLAFGQGIHYCLGARLARLELHLALAALLQRFPGLRLADPDGVPAWNSGLLSRGPSTLHVAW